MAAANVRPSAEKTMSRTAPWPLARSSRGAPVRASQTRIQPSNPPAAIDRPSGETARPSGSPADSSSASRSGPADRGADASSGRPVRTSQSRTMPSAAPVASTCPPGWNPWQRTEPMCVEVIRMTRFASTSQSMMPPSALNATVRPSRENAGMMTDPANDCRPSSRPLATSQTRTVRSWPPVASRRPSGEKQTPTRSAPCPASLART